MVRSGIGSGLISAGTCAALARVVRFLASVAGVVVVAVVALVVVVSVVLFFLAIVLWPFSPSALGARLNAAGRICTGRTRAFPCSLLVALC